MERAVHSLSSELRARLVVDGFEFPDAVHVDVQATEVKSFASRVEDPYGPIGVCWERRMARQK